MANSPRGKSLEELEGFLSDRSFGTELSQQLLRVRRIPLGELSPSDLRLLISQTDGTRHVVPIAVKLLEDDPWLEADYYQGDLLAALARLNVAHWPPEPEYRTRMAAIIERALEEPDRLGRGDTDARIETELRAARNRFRKDG